MQNCFSRDLARSLVVMLLEMQAEIREFSYQMDLEEQRYQKSQALSGSTGNPLSVRASCRAASNPG